MTVVAVLIPRAGKAIVLLGLTFFADTRFAALFAARGLPVERRLAAGAAFRRGLLAGERLPLDVFRAVAPRSSFCCVG